MTSAKAEAEIRDHVDELKRLAAMLAVDDAETRIMEFCGGHTHALVNSGLMSILPSNIRMVHGPGCPVCVLPAHHLQAVIDLLESDQSLTVAVYGDLLRIPTLRGDSLMNAQGRGHSVRIVYSPLNVLAMAEAEPERKFIFVAIGFETTAPATAVLLKKARDKDVKNVFVLCLHVLTPPAVEAVMEGLTPAERPRAIIGPGHVSMVTGTGIYEQAAKKYALPIVISGFEGLDLLESIAMSCRALIEKRTGVFNQYARALKPQGNLEAQRLLGAVFALRPTFVWRGLGELKNSALMIRDEWRAWDAEHRFEFKYRDVPEHPHCRCGDILRGKASPPDCKLFMKACTPSRPMGSCMVSSEGACHAYLQSGARV